MDFDEIIDRHNTDCLKFDAAVRRGYPEDILPLWVADMDFPAAQPVIEAIQKRTAHGIFGYSEPEPERFYRVLERWFREQHHWQIPAMVSSSSRVQTRPAGLWGLHSRNSFT